MSGISSTENHELIVSGMVVGLSAQRGCGDSICDVALHFSVLSLLWCFCDCVMPANAVRH